MHSVCVYISLTASILSLLQTFKELIYSGQLLREQTDVTAYEMDKQVCLAEICNGLKKLNYRINLSPYNTVDTYFSIHFFKKLC